MGTVAGMLAQARKLLGTGENPPGSNHNRVTEWYGFDGAWCDMAISYEAGHSDNLAAMMGKFAYTVAHATAFKNHGRWHYGLGGIRPGDVVFFDWGGSGSISKIDHVGLVEAVHSNGTITTLEGNTSNTFARRVRRSGVVGYGRPAYGDAAPMPSTDGMLRIGSTGNAVRSLQTNLNKVMNAGLAVDGRFGSKTADAVKAFQRKYHLAVDGVYGPASAAVMKAALAGKTAPTPPAPKPPSVAKLAVDGRFGPATTAALQRWLNRHGVSPALVVDGAMGTRTNKALQWYLKVAQDGRIGPVTIKALQAHLGVKSDGVWGSITTKALQARLNAGTF